MPTYTVHAPPPREGRNVEPERFRFVRDGFHFWAFLLAPLWLLFRRLWLVFVLYVIVTVALEVALTAAGLPGYVKAIAGLLVALFVGLEAGGLRRWTLDRRGWTMLGFVTGDDLDDAERRFFTAWRTRGAAITPVAPPSEPPASRAVRRGPPSGHDVIGLFPEPGGAP
jgi:hypothetical protein